MVVAPHICNELSDQEIIRRALEEVDFFSCLYERYEARLLRYIRRLTSASAEEAEDILQEAFIKVWRNLHAYDPQLPFSSWLYRIVRNEAISAWRKQASHGKDQRVEPRESELADWLPDPGPPPEDAIDQDALPQMVHALIHQLPRKYQEVVLLRYWENMSYEEISDVLKVPEGTVATRLNRAKRSLRKLHPSDPHLRTSS